MKVASFHQTLLGGDPTPEQINLYESEARGFSNDQKDEAKFIATFVLGLYQTRDWEASTFRKVQFAVTRVIDPWVIAKINWIVKVIAEKRAGQNLPKSSNRMIVDAISHLEIGSRVHTIAVEPPHWVAYGFTKEIEAPSWLKKKLL
jgi:hypothetical protein